MAYRLRQGESVSKGLRRVVTRELKAGAQRLAVAEPSEDAIHDARKRIKKVRAVLQLLRHHKVGTRRDRKRLRRAGRLLSPLRDVDALLGTVDVFCEHGRKKLTTATCTVIRDVLKQHKQRLCADNYDRAGRRAAKALKRLRRSANDWPWQRVGFSVLFAEIQRSYKRARRHMARAQQSNAANDFHQWRKRVKTLWYGLRLLEARVPCRRSRLELERLEACLGGDHDLLALRTHVRADHRVAASARAEVGALSEQRQSELRRKALSIGARLFKATPKAFARQFRRQWRSGPRLSE